MRILLFTSALLLVVPASASAHARREAITHPTAPAKVVVRVTTGGGFVTPETNLRALPSFTLYGDGTVIVPGVIPQLSPGPALYPLLRHKLSERQVQALLKRAQAAGLLSKRVIDYGNMGSVGVSDGPTTALVVNASGRHVVRQAYALGMGGGSGRLSAQQLAARQALARFIAGLPVKPSGTRYTPHAIAIYVAPSTGPAQAGAGRVTWPLKSNLASAGKPLASGLAYRCITVSGKDVAPLIARLRVANEQSRWVMRGQAGRTYQVVARPLLPDEPACHIATP